MEECRSLSRKGITAEELQDAKTFMKGNLALNMESIEVRMGQLAKNEITFGRHFTFNEIREQIDSVTMDDFMSLVSRLFDNKRLSLISVGRMSPDPEDSPDLGV
jgi:predicted Zn-dependent peptidase